MLKSDPDFDPAGRPRMKFRLTYEGRLLGCTQSNTRAQHKHEIRKVFHRQLRELWVKNKTLSERWPLNIEPPDKPLSPYVDDLGSMFAMFGYRFFPLVQERLELHCDLHVLFLRPDMPGSVIRSGDIDNRMATIFDALRIPSDASQLGRHTVPAEDEDPFVCLLQDDKLISSVSIETDLLLQPTGPQFDANDSRLVITVTLRPYRATMDNLDFA